VVSPLFNEQLAGSGDLPREADTSTAKNTTVMVDNNLRTEVFIGTNPLVFFKAAVSITILERVVLEIALPGLIANGAIERVVQQ
jgi:hypothetical protein